jgi:hypothetical protein
MSILLLQRTLSGVVKSGLYSGVDGAVSDGNPNASQYVDVRPYRYVKWSMQSQGFAADNPGNTGAALSIRLVGCDSKTTGIPAATGSAGPNPLGYASLLLGEGHGERVDYVAPFFSVTHPNGNGQDVELDGDTVFELRGYL